MVTAYLERLRLFSRDARLYLISAALIGFTLWGVYAGFLNLYLLRLGYGPEFIGMINALGMLSGTVFSLPAGTLGGRWGIRRTMIVGLGLTAAGCGLLPLAESVWAGWQHGWLLATYALLWLGFALYMVNAAAFVTGATGTEERTYVFSVEGALWSLAGFAGSLVGGLLPALFATILGGDMESPAFFRYSLVIAGLALIPALMAMLATHEVRAERSESLEAEEPDVAKGSAPYSLIVPMALVVLLGTAGESATDTFYNVYLDVVLRVSASQIGVLTAVGQLLTVPAALGAPILIARWGKKRAYIPASLGSVPSLLLLGLIPQLGAAALGLLGLIALTSIARPAFTVYQQEIVSPGWRSVMSGATMAAAGLSPAGMAFGGGYLIVAQGYRSFFILAAALTAVGILLFSAYFRVSREELAHVSALVGPEGVN
jgi:MFS family permease